MGLSRIPDVDEPALPLAERLRGAGLGNALEEITVRRIDGGNDGHIVDDGL